MAILGGQGYDSDEIYNVYSEIRHVFHVGAKIPDQEECAQWYLFVEHF